MATQESTARAERHVQAMIELGRSLTAVHDLDELLRLVVERVTELLEADRTTLFLVDDKRKEIWSKVAQGQSVKEIRMPLGRGVAGWVAQNGKSINLRDAYKDDRFNPEVDRESGYKTCSLICIPLRGKRGDVLGVLQALNKKDGYFSVDDEKMLEAISSQVSVAIENAQLVLSVLDKNLELIEAQEALARRVHEQEILLRLEAEIGSALRAEDILTRLLHQVVDAVGCEAGSVLQVTEETGDLTFAAAVGEKEEAVKHLQLPRGAGVVGWVAEHGSSALINEPERDPRHLKSIGKDLDFPIRNILAVPLSLGGERIGALELLNKKSGGFDSDDEKLAKLIAGRAVTAIQVGRQRQAVELDARLKSIGQALSGVIHDFRTPMTIISGYVQLMAMEGDKEKRSKQAETTLRQFDFMNDMTRELLAFARGESKLLLHKVYTNRLFKDLRELLQRELELSGVELHLDDVFEGVLRVDENKLRRLIFNITRNARQAMPEGGDFTIRVEGQDNGVLFLFTDTGSGIPEEVRPRLFESFVTSGKEGGTGLGLAVVKKIVDEHQGTIKVESPPEGGACFRIWLPSRMEKRS